MRVTHLVPHFKFQVKLSRHAGIPDVVLHEKTGLLCNEKDVDGMAANMMKILKEDGLARKLGQAGRERVKNHFTMEKHLGILEKVIKEAVSKKRTMRDK